MPPAKNLATETTEGEAQESKPAMTLRDVLRDFNGGRASSDAYEVPSISLLPKLGRAEDLVRRSPRSQPVPDLSGLAHVWLTIGEGGNGKTTFSRYLADQLVVRGLGDQVALATIAPGNRALASYFDGLLQPDSAEPRDVAEWTHRLLLALAQGRANGLVDSGGGDLGLSHLVSREPALASDLEERGLGVVAAYFLSPRVDDVTFLASYDAAGFKPRATALVCNLGRAASPREFDDVRRQPAYKAALDRGAVELWMPALPWDIVRTIERKRLRFSEAAAGAGEFTMWERSEVNRWLEAMARELEPVATWLPWA